MKTLDERVEDLEDGLSAWSVIPCLAILLAAHQCSVVDSQNRITALEAAKANAENPIRQNCWAHGGRVIEVVGPVCILPKATP